MYVGACTHVWVHVHMWTPVIDIENHLNCSSTLFKEALFLNQTQSSPLCLTSQLAWGCCVFTFKGQHYT